MEIGVASTKAYTAQLTAFALLAAWLAEQRSAMTPSEIQEFTRQLVELLENMVLIQYV